MARDLFSGYRVIGLDLETTGLNYRSDRIVQYALIGSHVDGVHVNIESLVHPQRKIPHESSRIHGISNDDVVGALPFNEHIDLIGEMVDDAVVVGHNVLSFDWPFLEAEFLRAGRMLPKPAAIIDTLRLARRLKLRKPRTLGDLCKRFSIQLLNAHTAGADAGATLQLLWRFAEDHPRIFSQSLEGIEAWQSGTKTDEESSLGRTLDDLEPIDTQGRLRRDGEEIVFAFGRHKKKTLGEVVNDDPEYIDWLMGNLNQEVREIVKEKLESEQYTKNNTA